MKTNQAIIIVEGMRHLEQSHLQHLENYEEPQFHEHLIAHCFVEKSRETFNRRLANHKILVGNARDRVDALDIALRALMHFQS